MNYKLKQLAKRDKLALFSAMYGAARVGTNYHQNMVQTQAQGHTIVRTHPLEYVSGYKLVENDKRFGGVPVYKVVTKTLSEIIGRKEKVPHTSLYYRLLDEIESQAEAGVAAIAWVRRTSKEELEQAVATLLMMGKTPVILRAFTP